jgi:beta-galactosidase
MLPEASGAVLRRYVQQGGTLVAEARLGWNNERGYAAERVPGLGLSEVVGAVETSVETAPPARTTIAWASDEWPGLPAGARLAGRWYRETLEPLSASSRVVGRFEDGSAAAVVSSFGKGRTLMLGTYVSAAYQSQPTPDVARFFATLLEWAGVTRPIEVSGSPVEVRWLESAESALLFVFNHQQTAARARIVVARPGTVSAADMVSGSTVPLSATPGGFAVDLEIPPEDVRVLQAHSR